MNVEIAAEAVQFPDKEYINGIAVAVQLTLKNTKWATYIQAKQKQRSGQHTPARKKMFF
jgi:hypothetical protein